ncbi:phosphoenolpyruvate carboxylase [Psychrosphaera ytuae]|uniref:Phosphoenolpyruvate carboxylase n=1 Tax=Psychrosphaera ytuae TaxID=2820710 RepID=A0A975DF95_9GAMM|nr:phosphoenolpyruvate carboxylase [Psychrosphaera ytuae]QTH64555.1 phosphoenolpyruvate carboxylase [Psychrosphaera ytuae]
MATFSDPALQQRIRDLGNTLGETIANELGEDWLSQIEEIRLAGRSSAEGESKATQALQDKLASLDESSLLIVARAFSQFLNLANIAEQEFNSSHVMTDVLTELSTKLNGENIAPEQVKKAVDKLNIDLVLTAHPTEVIRRTFIHKYSELTACLAKLDHGQLSEFEREQVSQRIAVLIAQAWHTDEIRAARPTPVDEAKWGLAVIEKSLWHAVPKFMRELDRQLDKNFNVCLPIDSVPVQINSWMGGDRDGNPFVTAKVTQEVLWYARHRAAELFAQDLETLCAELSMSACTDELKELVVKQQLKQNNKDNKGNASKEYDLKERGLKEPYRALLNPLRKSLLESQASLAECLAELNEENTHLSSTNLEDGVSPERQPILISQEKLLEPLLVCYRSLVASGMASIANDRLLDTIRRAYCFGVHLLKLDIRQDSERHADAIAEVTKYLDIGDYNAWSEQEKQAFLVKELQSKRPLFPSKWPCSEEVQEVLDTCKTIAQNEAHAFGIYIISMATYPSDVLAVKLLLSEAGVDWPMPVAPLFETLDDLNGAEATMAALFDIDWYKQQLSAETSFANTELDANANNKAKQYVMIGYSDSAKDAGALAAGWAQYEAQEKLIALSERNNIGLTLFHGRGGTIGRGGLPAYEAIRSQPPGSLTGGFRITEQGETIRYKFGNSHLANQSLTLYASAILESMLLPSPKPKQSWRDAMTAMAAKARDNYRGFVRHDPNFVPYFRTATPEQELGKLPLGSRPAKRKPQGGVESLRAIPWIFAWAQTRLVLPSWLGVMPAVQDYIDETKNPEGQSLGLDTINEMLDEWPFFKSRLLMLDMVFSKANSDISAAFDKRLVPDDLLPIGETLRAQLKDSMSLLLTLLKQEEVMESDPKGKESMQIRSAYLEPLHYLQIELLSRIRANDEELPISSDLEQAMMVTIGGIAIGMRNTG